MNGLLLRVQGVRRWHLDTHEYGPGDRATGTLSVTAGERSHALRLAGVLDDRWMGEIGCDEIRVTDAGDVNSSQLDFGRYRLEFWTRGEMGTGGSFVIDSFETLLFTIRAVFLAHGRGTVVVPDRFPFDGDLRAGDDVVICGGDRPPLPTTVWAVKTEGRGAAHLPPDAPAAVLLPADVGPEVRVGQGVWLASHRPIPEPERRRQ